MERKTTKDVLAESFLELAQIKTIDHITINDIVQNCGMTKPTFYRYFMDKYDLIAWIYLQTIQKDVDKIGMNGYQWKDTLLDGTRYFEKNRKYVVNALKHTSGRNSFINQFISINIDILTKIIEKKFEDNKVPDIIRDSIKVYCFGTAHYICDWLLDNKSSSCEFAAAVMENCIPDILKPFLLE